MISVQNFIKHYSANWLVFTDLDGTLLDRSYNLQAGGKAMDELHQHGCICMPASSKTHIEMAELSKYRKFPSPYIFENGAGLRWPSAAGPEVFGRSASEIADLLDHIREEHDIKYRLFRDIGCAELCSITGLDEAGATAAKQRIGSMPLLWEDTADALETFQGILGFIGLQVVRGGLFQTVLDRSCSKAVAMRKICEHFSRDGRKPVLVACGDAENDLEMLRAADIAILFPNSNGEYLPFDHPALHYASGFGHEAWLDTLQKVLSLESNAEELSLSKSEHQSGE